LTSLLLTSESTASNDERHVTTVTSRAPARESPPTLIRHKVELTSHLS